MSSIKNQGTFLALNLPLRPLCLLALAALLTPTWAPLRAQANGKHAAHYQETDLVSNQAGVALLQDTNLLNAWGISFSATSPFWVSANHSARSVLYTVTNDPSGSPHVSKVGLEVKIPGEGSPTGQVFNNTSGFHSNLFLFASEDGIISGWRGSLGTAAEVLVSNSNAVYKGITIATGFSGPVLLAANFGEGTLDAYDANLNPLGQFTDPKAPAGYAPFNVLDINGIVFVTFAKQDQFKHDDVPGPGHGLIDVFNLQTESFLRFATGTDGGGKLKEINSPWGLALSPAGFGKHNDELLVGNFGSGTIMSFNAKGKFRGVLDGVNGGPIVIKGLWGLAFGNGGRGGVPGTLYFSAGPDAEVNGLFGSLEPVENQGHGHHHHGQGQDMDGDHDNDQGPDHD
jgi:uncharacterized protein (TIGR03118 family)